MTLIDLLSLTGSLASIVSESKAAKALYDEKKIAPSPPDYSMVPEDMKPFVEAVDEYLSSKKSLPIITEKERAAFCEEFYRRYRELYYNHDYCDRLINQALNELEAYLQVKMSVGEKVIRRQLDGQAQELNAISQKQDLILEVLLQEHSSNKALANYYERKRKEFEEKPKDSSIVGGMSLKDAYIEIDVAFTKNEVRKATDFLISRCEKYPCGAYVLYGEPGHGKTTFGLKLVYDYIVGHIKFKVFSFPLVSPYYSIVDGDKLHIYDALLLDKYQTDSKLDDELIENSLIILDGYDELQTTLRPDNPYTSFIRFYKAINEFAEDKKAHILITTRSMTIDGLSKEEIKILKKSPNRLVKMELMTEESQTSWIQSHVPEYLPKYLHLRERFAESKKPNEIKEDIFGIPFIFLMVVAAEFDDEADNLVELYDKLFDSTFRRRNPEISKSDIRKEREKYEYLAYLMYLDKGKYAEISNSIDLGDYSLYTYSYYMKVFLAGQDADDEAIEKISTIDAGESTEFRRFIEFYHKTFFEYFLAYYLYNQFQNVTEESADDFLYAIGERNIEFYVLKYIKQIVENRQEQYNKTIQERLEKNNALIVRDDPEPLRRANTIFINAMKLMNVISGGLAIHDTITGSFSSYEDTKLCSMLRLYRCRGIDLSGAKMTGAHLDRVDFRKSDFVGADMTGSADFSMSFFNTCSFKDANLEGIQMFRAIFDGSFMIGTNMSNGRYEEGSFKKTKFEKADLRGSNFKKVNMSGAKLTDVIVDENTDFTGAIFDGMTTNVDLSVCITDFRELVDRGTIKFLG